MVITATLVVAGSVIAGYDSFNEDCFGYLLIWGNNFSQSIYTVISAAYNKDGKITSFETNFFFALIGLPLMACITIYTGEIQMLVDAVFVTRDPQMLLLILLSGCSGILITICSILTVYLCGPVGLNISGIIKDVGLTFVGFAFFKNKQVTAETVVGITLSFVGATYFIWANFQTKKQQAKAAEEEKNKMK